MKINNLTAGSYTNKLNFKSAYIVEPNISSNLGEAVLPVNYDSLFSYDNSKTNELYNVMKADENKKISLLHYGDIVQFADTAKPSMVLVDDEIAADAHSHIELKKDYEKNMQDLENKSAKDLKNMLTKKERKLIQPSIKSNPQNKLEILKNAVVKSLRSTFRLKEEKFYVDMFKKAIQLKSGDIQKFKSIA